MPISVKAMLFAVDQVRVRVRHVDAGRVALVHDLAAMHDEQR